MCLRCTRYRCHLVRKFRLFLTHLAKFFLLGRLIGIDTGWLLKVSEGYAVMVSSSREAVCLGIQVISKVYDEGEADGRLLVDVLNCNDHVVEWATEVPLANLFLISRSRFQLLID